MTVAEENEVTCNRCGHTAVPNFLFDYYPDRKSDGPDAMICERCMIQEAFAETPPTGGELSLPPADYVNSICRIGQGKATCAFLALNPDGMRCAKGSSLEPAIRQRLEEGTMRAQGDNCSGPPDFTPSTSTSS